VTSTAAQPVTLVTESGEEIVRETRERRVRGNPQTRARLILASWGAAVAVAVFGIAAVTLAQGHSVRWGWVAFFVVVYAAVSTVEFEVGFGGAVPTELIFVPMVFALPLGLFPAAIAVAMLLRTIPASGAALLSPSRALAHLGNAAHALGPVLVLWVAGGLPLRWTAWPVYVVALGAQFVTDLLNTTVIGLATGLNMRSTLRFTGIAQAVDLALAPVGLVIAFAASGRQWVVLLVLPLVALLRVFATERKHRITNAIELSDAYRGTAFLLGDVVEADDEYTGSHSRHVVDLVLAVADELGLDASGRRDAEFVALLHDVGKIRVPSEIINKPGPLTVEERAVIEQHTIEGEKMLDRVGGLIGHVGRLVRSCHEHYDGNGYPDRLAGEDIPLIARIVCACDAYSAMTTDRPYRKARTKEAALAELVRCSGTQFDPAVVDAIVMAEA
jgi:HD-GYP domain-containing protein (c-di-GMP phosphodiesterase class II)